MKILIISPEGRHTAVGKKFKFPFPTAGAPMVAALTPEGHDIRIIDEIVEDINFDEPADIVAISSMTPMASRAYEVAAEFRKRGAKVVIGGIHPSACPEEAAQYADAVVIGEAEDLWPQAVKDAEAGRLQQFYKKDYWHPLTGLPRPKWELLRTDKYFPITIVETSRGCPHNCDFCAVTNFYGGKYRTRPVEEVEKEIQWLYDRPALTGLKRFTTPYPKGMIFFADSNIVANRKYAKELFTMLAKYRIPWQSYATISIADDPELLKLAQASNCVGLAIGFESLSGDNLKKIGKGFNKPEKYAESIKKLKDHGIGIIASFIFGLDWDDVGVFERTLDFINKNKIDSSFFLISTPLPGTGYRERLLSEGRVFDQNWDHYDCTHVVFQPKLMTPEQLSEGVYWLWRQTLSHKSIWKRLYGGSQFMFYIGMNYAMKMLDAKIHPKHSNNPALLKT